MARSVKPEEFASKRKDILDSVQRLMFTKGYENMSIRDILVDVGISNGAFHHYFGSRAALLDAFIEMIRQESNKLLLPVIQDPELSAIEKLQGFFDALDRSRMTVKAEVAKVGKFWYTDANALVRLKVDEAVTLTRAPLLTTIVQQGIQEQIFTTQDPVKAGEVILSLLQGMANTHARLLFTSKPGDDNLNCIEEIVATHAAYMDAIERVLGAPSNSLNRTDTNAVKIWVSVIHDEDPP